MPKPLPRVMRAPRWFHQDKSGLAAIRVVMILAILALAVVVVKTKWHWIVGLFGADAAGDWS